MGGSEKLRWIIHTIRMYIKKKSRQNKKLDYILNKRGKFDYHLLAVVIQVKKKRWKTEISFLYYCVFFSSCCYYLLVTRNKSIISTTTSKQYKQLYEHNNNNNNNNDNNIIHDLGLISTLLFFIAGIGRITETWKCQIRQKKKIVCSNDDVDDDFCAV